MGVASFIVIYDSNNSNSVGQRQLHNVQVHVVTLVLLLRSVGQHLAVGGYVCSCWHVG